MRMRNRGRKQKVSKKLGLALGAGGSRGVAHIGFLKALEEEGIKPDYIAGTSMGSVVGAACAAGVSVDSMKRAVNSLRLFDLIMPTKKRGGFFDTKKMRRILSHYIGDINFTDLEVPFRCVAVDMIAQKTVVFKEGSVLDAVVASSTIPSIFLPTEREGKRLVDGGVLERVPYKQVKEMGAEVVVVVDVLGQRHCKEDMPGPIGVMLEAIDIMDNHRTALLKKLDKKYYDIWLEPELGEMSQYTFKRMEFAYDKGYEIGKANVEKIKKAIQ